MPIVAQIVGLLAVALILWSYQQKKRKNIIIFNVISRCLYILQLSSFGRVFGSGS